MKILLINGSPKGKSSNSLRLAERFIAGVRKGTESNEEVSLHEIHAASLKIAPCCGCFSCWKKTPGKCIIHDDMEMIIEKEIEANIIVWSFPLYYFNVPGILKNLIDRQLPMNLPFMSTRKDGYGSGSHDRRFDTEKTRHVLISTCGFYSAEGNYDSVRAMFSHFLGKDRFDTIFCGQGGLFTEKDISERTEEYLGYVEEAGTEFAKGEISERTHKKLQTLLYPKEVFEAMADASWGVSKASCEKETKDSALTRQIAALYNKDAYDGKDHVLEIHYTDIDKTYQILLGKDGSKVHMDGSLTATTRIDTPFEVWASIARGEMGPGEALGRQLYTVSGDFSLMVRWSNLFGCRTTRSEPNSEQGPSGKKLKDPSMTIMLIPWIVYWTAVAFDPGIGSIIALAVCAVIPLIMRNRRVVIWDQLTLAAVGTLSAAANISGDASTFASLGYLAFGLLWLVSCLVKEPLTATYVKYKYGGDSACRNILFMKTNYILTACWGVLYVLSAIWTFVLQSDGLGIMSHIINYFVPAVMGVFTVWFQKWYPAYVASGSGRKHRSL